MDFIKQDDIFAVNGTHLQGYVFATYDEIKAILGEPNDGPDADIDGKVTCEWIIEFEDGTVATIYDWKTYSGTPRAGYEWHVGGKSTRVVRIVEEMLAGDHYLVDEFEETFDLHSD